MDKICKHCGAISQEADKISMWGMHDDHSFRRYKSKTVDELLRHWIADVESGVDVSLCPIIVLSGKKELRRVGNMLFCDYKTQKPKDMDAVKKFRSAVLADTEITRLMNPQ